MTIPLESIPRFTAAGSAGRARPREFGIAGAVAALPSERDQNFLVADAKAAPEFVVEDRQYADDAPELPDFQNRAMRHVDSSRRRAAACKRVSRRGRADRRPVRSPPIPGRAGITACGVLTWIDGEVLAKTASRGAGAVSEPIGAGLAKAPTPRCADFSAPGHAPRPAMGPAAGREWPSGTSRAAAGRPERARVERLFSQWERNRLDGA